MFAIFRLSGLASLVFVMLRLLGTSLKTIRAFSISTMLSLFRCSDMQFVSLNRNMELKLVEISLSLMLLILDYFSLDEAIAVPGTCTVCLCEASSAASS